VPLLDLNQTADENTALIRLFKSAEERTNSRARAMTLLAPLIDFREFPSREQFMHLRFWSPLLARLAWERADRLAGLLAELRLESRDYRSNGAAPTLSAYWTGTQAMAQAFLIASEIGARGRLLQVSEQFTGRPWSPTLPLLAERSIWLAAVAAVVAAAFGERVVENYLITLAGPLRPLQLFDCLYCLTSIGLSHRWMTPTLLRELRSLKAIALKRQAQSLYVERCYAGAIERLRSLGTGNKESETTTRELSWRSISVTGLATAQALRADPTRFSRSHGFLGFAALGTIVGTPIDSFFPIAERGKRPLRPTKLSLANMIERSRGPDNDDMVAIASPDSK